VRWALFPWSPRTNFKNIRSIKSLSGRGGGDKKMSKSSVAILGVPVDNMTMKEVLDSVEAMIEEGGFHQVATANADFLIKSIHDDELQEVLCRCDLVLADGMPLVWASRLMSTGLKERVAGADLVPLLVELSARRGYRLFLLGADEESSVRAAEWMKKRYPGVCIAGRYSPEYQPLEEMDHEEILSRIRTAKPDILLVAFGNPKQEKWLAMHRSRLNVPVCIGVGASLDFLSGRVSRAPLWMQHFGMEWLYRTIQEPSRLAKRYANNATGLLRYLTIQLAATLAQTKQLALTQLSKDTAGTSVILRVQGNFTGGLLPRFETEARTAVLSRFHVVLDLSRTNYIGPDALGCLIHLSGMARCWKRELWLTGIRPGLRRVLRATQLATSFRVAPKVTDALRRIQPDAEPSLLRSDKDWTFCRIGGQVIPIHAEEVEDVYRQVRFLLEQNFINQQLSFSASTGQTQEGRPGSLLPSGAL
jgi:N-acetylglucosaminyldiphosphoundecaprenol N-acetyl-beta-D-mannosaminyltransferase